MMCNTKDPYYLLGHYQNVTHLFVGSHNSRIKCNKKDDCRWFLV